MAYAMLTTFKKKVLLEKSFNESAETVPIEKERGRSIEKQTVNGQSTKTKTYFHDKISKLDQLMYMYIFHWGHIVQKFADLGPCMNIGDLLFININLIILYMYCFCFCRLHRYVMTRYVQIHAQKIMKKKK